MMPICIPKPCHEDWATMTAHEQGRHCHVCCKTVVDFTSMNDEEVKYFFINKKKEASVCGRFRNEQLQNKKIQLPYNIHTISMPLWKRFLTACLLAFSSMLFSCDTMLGKTVMMGDVVDTEMPPCSSKTDLPAPPPPKYATGVVLLPIDTNYTTIMGAPEINICENPFWIEDTVQRPGSGSSFLPGSSNDSTNHDLQTQTTGNPVHKKNPPEADSINCEERDYY